MEPDWSMARPVTHLGTYLILRTPAGNLEHYIHFQISNLLVMVIYKKNVYSTSLQIVFT